jgi:single-strand DNA-binding protein
MNISGCEKMSLSVELNGTLHEVYPTQQITDKFKKRDFILEIPNGNYLQHIKCEATGNTCEKLDGVRIGSQVFAKCDLRGRIYQKKDGTKGQMNSLVAWEIKSEQAEYNEHSIAHIMSPF